MRETRNRRASPRTLQGLASSDRVFSVVSRIFCSNSVVRTRRDRLRF